MSVIINGTDGVTFNDSSLQGAAASPFGLKNRIINGDMVIDQRNAGASVTPSNNQYITDRWKINFSGNFTCQQNAGSVTPPVGFTNYLGATSTGTNTPTGTTTYSFVQSIEGYNVADLGFGTANAKTVTLSFWVRSSATGTFGGAIQANAQNRSYPFSYTINSANTWEFKTITIAGDTTGTWLTTNGIGLNVVLCMGGGASYQGTAGAWASSDLRTVTGQTNALATNGATFYVTGVQLEQNTSATPFERRLYGQEFINCQRYFQTTARIMPCVITSSTTSRRGYYPRTVTMRATPTETGTQGAGGTVSFFGSALNTGIDVDGATANAESNFTNYTASAEL